MLVALMLIIGSAAAASAEPTPRASRLRDVSFEAGCVSRATTDVRASADVDSLGGRRLDWVLRGPDLVGSGIVPWFSEDEEYGPLDFTLAPGRYRLTISRVDRDQVVVDRAFDVLRCVTAKASCRAVTFRNPAGNRPVRIEHRGDDYLVDRNPKGALTLPAGRSARVRSYSPVLQWEASGPGGDFAGSGTEGGGSEMVVSQHCGPTRTRGVVSCAIGRRGLVRAWLHPPDDRRLRYRVDDFYEPVRSGRVGRDRHLRLRLKPGQSYSFFSYRVGAAQPYDRAEPFEVVRCVTAKARPQEVRFRNPTYSTVRIAYRVVGSVQNTVIRLKADKSVTVPVAPGKLRWHTNAKRTVSRWRTDRGRGVLRIAT